MPCLSFSRFILFLSLASICVANPQVSFGGTASRPSVAAQDPAPPVGSRASDGEELSVRQASGLLASILSEILFFYHGRNRNFFQACLNSIHKNLFFQTSIRRAATTERAVAGQGGAGATRETCRRVVNPATSAAASAGVKRAPEGAALAAAAAEGSVVAESFPETGTLPTHPSSAPTSGSESSTR